MSRDGSLLKEKAWLGLEMQNCRHATAKIRRTKQDLGFNFTIHKLLHAEAEIVIEQAK